MKKLIYSTLGLIIVSSMILTGCKDKTSTPPVTPETPKPTITFKNTTGYTSANVKVLNTLPTSALKFGMVVSSTIDLKSIKVTRNYQGSGEVVIPTQAIGTGLKTISVDILDTLEANLKGAYVYTFYATDKDATTASNALTITATGPLLEISAQQVYNNKGIGKGGYDLVLGIPVSTVGTVQSTIDIFDNSTTSTIAKEWVVGSGNTTMFIKGPFSTQYLQLTTEDQLKALWDANVSKATNKLSGMVGGVGMMVLVKVIRTGTPIYYAMTIDDIVDGVGSDMDYTEFTYKY